MAALDPNVGVVGLGAMGGGMARSLRRAGYRVHACDVRNSVLQAFVEEDGVACATPADMAAACRVIVSVVVTAAQTEAVRLYAAFRGRHFREGPGYSVDMARATKFPLPLAATVHQQFMLASAAGLGMEDDSAVIKVFPGITLPSRTD